MQPTDVERIFCASMDGGIVVYTIAHLCLLVGALDW